MKPLRTYVREFADRAGYIAEKKSLDNSGDVRRARLLATLRISTVLDVGANVGVYGEALRRYGYGGRIVSFEPMGDAFRQLEVKAAADPLWDAHRVALGDTNGDAVLNVAASDPWSSLLQVDPRADEPERLQRVGGEAVRTARLESLPDVLGERTWLKLDVQGYELRALEGARGVLNHIRAIECEVSLEPFYEGQPSFREVVDQLYEAGFAVAAVRNGWMRETGRARWIDLVFVR